MMLQNDSFIFSSFRMKALKGEEQFKRNWQDGEYRFAEKHQ